MERFNFEKLELPHRIYHIAKFLGMEIDRYNQITSNRPMDVNPESIALAAIAYLELRGLTKYTFLQELVVDTLKILPEYRKGLSEATPAQKAQLEEFQRKMLPGIAQMHLSKAQEMYLRKAYNWAMVVEAHIKEIEWIAHICTGAVECTEFPVTLFYPATDREFDIDSFTSRIDLYECMMRGRYETMEEYKSDREDALILLGISEMDAKKILDTLAPYVFPKDK